MTHDACRMICTQNGSHILGQPEHVSGAKNGADRKSDERERSESGIFLKAVERGAMKSGRSHPLTTK